MATWKRLTELGGNKIDVNMDQIVIIQKVQQSPTDIIFVGGASTRVQETPDEIHQTKALQTS
jgi:CobQ-like glutamine amidotransferase family enzyme